VGELWKATVVVALLNLTIIVRPVLDHHTTTLELPKLRVDDPAALESRRLDAVVEILRKLR
jgi:hypothetical protein